MLPIVHVYVKSTQPDGLPYWTFSTCPCILLTNHKNVDWPNPPFHSRVQLKSQHVVRAACQVSRPGVAMPLQVSLLTVLGWNSDCFIHSAHFLAFPHINEVLVSWPDKFFTLIERNACWNSNLRTTFSGSWNLACCPLPFGYFQDIFTDQAQCSGKFSNVLHSNIINLVANDLAPTLTDWIVTTLYVCRIANALLPLLAFIAARLPESPSVAGGAGRGMAAVKSISAK